MSGSSTVQHAWDKPQGSVNLALEAWSEGLVLGALIIMTGITAANMRHGILLHKLIFLEVRRSTRTRRGEIVLTIDQACDCMARLRLYFLESPSIRLVPFIFLCTYDHIMADT